jgi:hypothetical protein
MNQKVQSLQSFQWKAIEDLHWERYRISSSLLLSCLVALNKRRRFPFEICRNIVKCQMIWGFVN